MNLSVAMRMNQNTVTLPSVPPHRFVDDVVVVPTRHVCDRLVQTGQLPPCSFQRWARFVFLAGSFPSLRRGVLQVGLPCGVVRVAVSFNFGVSGYRYGRGVAESVCTTFRLCPLLSRRSASSLDRPLSSGRHPSCPSSGASVLPIATAL